MLTLFPTDFCVFPLPIDGFLGTEGSGLNNAKHIFYLHHEVHAKDDF